MITDAESHPRAGRGPGRRTAIALFLLPALAPVRVFVLFPIVQAVRFSFYKWNGLAPLTDFVGLANYQRAVGRPGLPGRGDAQRADRRPVARRSRSRSRSALALMLNRRFRGRAVLRLLFFAPYVIAEVITGGRLEPASPAGRAGRRAAPPSVSETSTNPGSQIRTRCCSGLFVDHLVEVLRVPHDPHAGRAPGHPA